jgi:hypothetical protein
VRRRAQNFLNLQRSRAVALRISQTFSADASRHPEARIPLRPARRRARNFAFRHVARAAVLGNSLSFTAHEFLASRDAPAPYLLENILRKRKKPR